MIPALLIRAGANQILKRIRSAALRSSLLVAASLIAGYSYARRAPFLNDDYIFLDRTRDAGFASLWGTQSLMFGWWRPLSREFHYWWLQRAVGPNELVFHLVGLAVAIGALAVYFQIARRIAGVRAATVAIVATAALAAWAVPMVWVAGVQESWMLLFGLLSLHAFLARRPWIAAGFLAAALLSKESAAVVPGIAIALAMIADRLSARTVLMRALPMLVVTAGWALLHPALRTAASGGFEAPEGSASFTARVVRTLLVPFNLDHAPAPTEPWLAILKRTMPALIPLLLLLLYRPREDDEPNAAPKQAPKPVAEPWRVTVCGIVWALVAWMPAFWPGAGWHGYYTLLGAMGVWIALSPWVAVRRWVAVSVVVVLVALRGILGATPSTDWGTEGYQKRAASFVSFLRADLLRVVPKPEPNTRFFFTRVPTHIGFLTEGGPALRVWYRDPTLSGGFFSAYSARSSGAPDGPDRFFRYDSTTGWVEIHAGREASEPERQASARWSQDHRELAARFAAAGDWRSAAGEFVLLAGAEPDSARHPADAGVCFAMAGDSSSAARWFAVAARHPSADDQVKGWARAFERHLEPGIERH